MFKRAESKYEKTIKYRTQGGMLERQEEIWKKFADLDLDADAESFTNSEDMDDIMKRYEEALILKPSGLEDNIPKWMNPEEEHGAH